MVIYINGRWTAQRLAISMLSSSSMPCSHRRKLIRNKKFMKECAQCNNCYEDEAMHCPIDGGALQYTLPGGLLLAEKFRLEKLLARGSMGSVYRAQQEELQRT